MSDAKEREAEAFRQWFASQKRFSSLSAMERALNITKDYLHLIRDGKRRATDPELRRKLSEATGMEIFKPIPIVNILKPKTSFSKSIDTKSTEKMSSASVTQGASRLPENLSNLLKLALRKLDLTVPICSQKYGISPNMLKKYKRGVSKPASEKNVMAILNILEDANLTTPEQRYLFTASAKTSKQLIDIKPLVKEVNALRKKINQIDTKLTAAKLYEATGLKQESMNAEGRARRIMQMLLTLSKELEFFKQCSENERDLFKKIVPGQDVGYVTTLLRALYDEDKFQRWLLFSNYEMKGKDSDE